ncbi:Guanylate cyclase (Partial), partial [Seminavis robusta]
MIRLFRGNSAKKRQMAREPEINPLASLQSIKHMNYVSDNMQTSKLAKSWAIAETKVVNILRVSAIIALLVAAAVVATGVFLYTRNGEEQDFQIAFEDSAIQVIDSFHEAIERNMGAVASLSNSITSYALETNKSFPFVTLPHFEIKGSDIRAQSGSHLLHWCPLVSDHNRGDWEEYSFQNRHHATQAIQYDTKYRMEQDQMYGYGTRSRQRQLQQLQAQNETDSETQQFNEDLEALVSTDTQGVLGVRPTTLNDGSNYHPYIWTSGSTTPRGDVPQGSGDGNYMPLWQQSPADARLASALNLDVARSNFIAKDLIHTMQTEQMAVLNMAAEPREISKAQFQYYLKVSQYRHRAEELVDDWHTLLSYPVFDTFDADTRNVAGMITTDIYWKVFFSNLLPTNLRGLVCVITNSFNQTFS